VCLSRYTIDIGDIVIDKSGDENSTFDRYISFSQEFFENRDYPINRYCEDKRAILANNRFSSGDLYRFLKNNLWQQEKYPLGLCK